MYFDQNHWVKVKHVFFLSDSHPTKIVASPGKVYYIDEGKSSIFRINTDDTEPKAELVVDKLIQPHAVEVDIQNG